MRSWRPRRRRRRRQFDEHRGREINKDGQMTPDQMNAMSAHMKMMNEHMKGMMR